MIRIESAVRALLIAEAVDPLDRDAAIDTLSQTVAPSICIDAYLSLILPEELMKSGIVVNRKQLELFKEQPHDN